MLFSIWNKGGPYLLLVRLATALASVRQRGVEVNGVAGLLYSIFSPIFSFWWTRVGARVVLWVEIQSLCSDSPPELLTFQAYIYSTTKPCPNPRCRFRIHKTGGCSHMKCTKCNSVFCWYCGCDYRRTGHVARCSASLASEATMYSLYVGRFPFALLFTFLSPLTPFFVQFRHFCVARLLHRCSAHRVLDGLYQEVRDLGGAFA